MKSAARTLEQAPVDIAESRLPPPILSYAGGRRWRLEAEYAYRDAETTITVPKGFEFDLSSIPRLLWGLIAPFELSVAAPLLHDFLYFHAGKPPGGAVVPHRIYNRAEVDAMFRGIMRKEGVPRWRQVLGYLAVRAFGRGAWREPSP
jgi:Protein of unknown function (DUF1353)